MLMGYMCCIKEGDNIWLQDLILQDLIHTLKFIDSNSEGSEIKGYCCSGFPSWSVWRWSVTQSWLAKIVGDRFSQARISLILHTHNSNLHVRIMFYLLSKTYLYNYAGCHITFTIVIRHHHNWKHECWFILI